MKTISLDPVTPPLLLAGHLSFVTVDRPPPDGWIGQRVALHAENSLNATRGRLSGLSIAEYDALDVRIDAIVGSGTLVEALPITEDLEEFADLIACIQVAPNRMELYLWPEETSESHEAIDISDQLPLQDWTKPWALRFTDVAPTSERCPECEARPFWSCATCQGDGKRPPVLAPVLSGDDPTYKEWTPT